MKQISKESIIQDIHSLDLKTVSFDKVKELVSTLMNNFYSQFMMVPATPLCRARKNENDQVFNHINKLRNPNKNLVTNFGRLNIPNESIFYGAAHHNTAILELQPEIGDEITIYRSILHNGIRLRTMELGMRESVWQNKGRIYDDSDIHKYIGSDKNISINKQIHDFLINQFTQVISNGQEYKYKITAAIAHTFMNDKQIEGLVYPSIATGKKQVNIGIKPEVYDKYYAPYDCWKIKIKNIFQENKYEVMHIATAKSISKSGKIIW